MVTNGVLSPQNRPQRPLNRHQGRHLTLEIPPHLRHRDLSNWPPLPLPPYPKGVRGPQPPTTRVTGPVAGPVTSGDPGLSSHGEPVELAAATCPSGAPWGPAEIGRTPTRWGRGRLRRTVVREALSNRPPLPSPPDPRGGAPSPRAPQQPRRPALPVYPQWPNSVRCRKRPCHRRDLRATIRRRRPPEGHRETFQ